MANIFLESFDNVTINDFEKKGYTSITTIGPSLDTGGRTNNCLKLIPYAYAQSCINKILPSSYSRIIFGVAFKTSYDFRSEQILWSFADSSNDQFSIAMDSACRLKFYSGINGVLLGTSSKVYDRGSFYYFEFKITFSTTGSGSIDYRVNGLSQPQISSVTTAAFSSGVCNILRLWEPAGNWWDANQSPFYLDDMYMNDTTGSDNNDYMGDVRIFVDRPAASVGTPQWAVTGAVSNAAAVGDVTPDGDTSYISSNTAGQVDLYSLQAPPSGVGVVKAVQTNLVARKDDGIIRQVAPVLGDGVHTNVVGASVSIGNNYVDYLQSFDRNPLTGTAWAVGDLSTLRLGVKEIV